MSYLVPDLSWPEDPLPVPSTAFTGDVTITKAASRPMRLPPSRWLTSQERAEAVARIVTYASQQRCRCSRVGKCLRCHARTLRERDRASRRMNRRRAA